MYKRPKYIVGGREFKSQPELRAAISGVANTHDLDGSTAVRVKNEYVDFVFDFFSEHFKFNEKQGVGVAYYLVGRGWHTKGPDGEALPDAGGHPTFCFFIVRTDGSAIDIGVDGCFSVADDRSDRFDEACWSATQALRDEVRRDAFAGGGGVYVCPETGQQMTEHREAVTSHCPPEMGEIIVEWKAASGRTPNNTPVTGQKKREFAPDVAAEFKAFYEGRARLRVISRYAFARRMRAGCREFQ